jgi:hypothetical protein
MAKQRAADEPQAASEAVFDSLIAGLRQSSNELDLRGNRQSPAATGPGEDTPQCAA